MKATKSLVLQCDSCTILTGSKTFDMFTFQCLAVKGDVEFTVHWALVAC